MMVNGFYYFNDMANAYRDENSIPTIIGIRNTDGSTITRIKANPTNHRMSISDGNTGTDHGPTNDARDENDVTCFMAVSSGDGQTPVVLYVNSSNQLLIQST